MSETTTNLRTDQTSSGDGNDRSITLPLLPLTTGVVLPQMVVTLALETSEARASANAALAGDGLVLLLPRRGNDFARVGAIAKIEDAGPLPGRGRLRAVITRGLRRGIAGVAVPGPADSGALHVRVEPVDESTEPSARTHQLATEYRLVIESILERRGAARLLEGLKGVTDPSDVADLAGWSPDLSLDQKIELLETIDVETRLEKAIAWAKETLAELDLKSRIERDVAEGIDKRQREFMLRQQLDAIRKELREIGADGAGDDPADVVAQYRRRLDEGAIPDAVRTAVEREIDRFERTSEQSPEHGWIRTWLDWVTEMPWGIRSDERLDLAEARAILEADHTGLDDVKQRLLEHLAVRKLRLERNIDGNVNEEHTDDRQRSSSGAGAILALVGPPGVGKTSLGESIARALGRKYVRVALGGVRDEAEIRGHRRTYVGAQPGRIARAMHEAGTQNPVFVLDEVDKVGADWRGDPSSALLEVLDPAQNHSFRDHYLEVELDLSDVLFIATANIIETIPSALLDRMEIVHLDGYTDHEKVAIARDHLLRRQAARNGLHDGEVVISDAALVDIVSGYTREAGVRTLERELGKVLRKVAIEVAEGVTTPVLVDEVAVRRLLGRPKVFHESIDRTAVAGVATGLAVTGTGGDVLFVEAAAVPVNGGASGAGSGTLHVTGQLGDVMRESAEIAGSYVRAHALELSLPIDAFEGRRFHVHVPAGAVPKDGPSAGVTMVTALTSLLTGRPVRSTVGMTGEVTLQGRVLPIGGVKQKVLAAHRAGLREVVLPERNGPDLDDVPAAVRDEMTFHLANNVTQVLAVALEPV